MELYHKCSTIINHNVMSTRCMFVYNVTFYQTSTYINGIISKRKSTKVSFVDNIWSYLEYY